MPTNRLLSRVHSVGTESTETAKLRDLSLLTHDIMKRRNCFLSVKLEVFKSIGISSSSASFFLLSWLFNLIYFLAKHLQELLNGSLPVSFALSLSRFYFSCIENRFLFLHKIF